MGQLKKAAMQILTDDMGGSEPVDPNLAQYILDSQPDYVKDDSGFEVAHLVADLHRDIDILNNYKADLKQFNQENNIDEAIAKLTKLAEKL